MSGGALGCYLIDALERFVSIGASRWQRLSARKDVRNGTIDAGIVTAYVSGASEAEVVDIVGVLTSAAALPSPATLQCPSQG